MGKELAGYLDQAGFTDTRISASYETFSGPKGRQLIYDLGEEWYFSYSLRNPAEQYGAASASLMDEIKLTRDRWHQASGAMAAFAYGEALAVRP